MQAVNWLKAEYEKAAAGRTDVSIQLFEHTWAQPSLIVTVAGSGNNRGETVILGGHMDSTAGGATRASPGADDDGSGSAAVLEVRRVCLVFFPSFFFTVFFLFWCVCYWYCILLLYHLHFFF